MKFRARSLALALTLALGAIACGGDPVADETEKIVEDAEQERSEEAATEFDDDDSAPVDDIGEDDIASISNDNEQANWTVLVYVMGDNDLELFAVGDIFEMAEAGSNEHLNIVTLIDRHPGYANDEIGPLGNFEGTQLIHVGKEEILQSVELGELNTGSADELAGFVAAGIQQFPADRYALIIWDHGAGWPGMGPDETDGEDILTLPEMGEGITKGLEVAGVERLDLIGFDACLMGTFEVAHAMRDVADVMVASEELEPGHGWDFSSLEILRSGDDVSAAELATTIVDTYEAHAKDFGTAFDITLSAVDLTKLGELDAALREFGDVMEFADSALLAALGSARQDSLAFGDSPDPALATNAVDLGVLMNELSANNISVSPEADAVLGALDTVVFHEISGIATSKATGLSVYFPPSSDYFDSDYFDLGEVPGWSKVLNSYFDGGSRLASTGTVAFDEEIGLEYFFDESGINLFGTVIEGGSNSIVSAEILYGVIDDSDGSIIFIGEEPADYTSFGDGTGEVYGFYDLTALTLSDGIDTDYAYLDMEFDEESGFLFFDVPLWYVPPEEFDTDDPYHDLVLALTLDAEGNIVSEVYYEFTDDGMIGELSADPDGLIFPIVLNEYPDGTAEWLTLSEVGLYADLPNLIYDLEPLDSGLEIYVELVITDYAGNVSAQGGFVTLP